MAKLTTDQICEEVTSKMISAIQGGNIPWRRPWNGGGLPRSLSTGKTYGFRNVVILWAAGYSSPHWGTFKAIQKAGGKIRKGQKHTKIVFWKTVTVKEKDKKTGEEKFLSFPVLRSHQVFNSEQCDWEEDRDPTFKGTRSLEFVPIEEAERVAQEFLGSSQAPKFQEQIAKAFYHFSEDLVNMPKRETFDSVEEWYSTLFHELVHSTGHESRLAREGVAEGHFFGDAVYSREELIAEMGAAFLCALTGIDCSQTFENSAAYMRGWVKALQDDRRLVVVAAGRAQKALTCILGEKAKEGET